MSNGIKTDTDNISVASTAPPEPPKRRLLQNKWLLLGVLVIFVIGAVFALYKVHSKSARISGSPECLSWVKKIEGRNYSGIYSLGCSLSARKIANSSLTAQYLEYSGAPKDTSVCIDPYFTSPPTPGSEYCVNWYGVVLSNGETLHGLGSKDSPTPIEYDYCYSARIDVQNKQQPTIHDLYYYQGALYDRDVFKSVEFKTAYGTCLLNGTTLSRSDKTVNTAYITNVKIDYNGFPKDCRTVTIGRAADDSISCAVLVTIANASLDACYSNGTPLVTNGKITGYKKELQVYVGQYINGDCENAYVQRMAALNRCDDIVSDKLRTSCKPKVAQPFADVTRVSTAL